MKIQVGKTFTKSLKKLYWQNTKIYKFYSFFRYDMPRFFKNIWIFRKALYEHRWFDHHGTLMFLQYGLKHISDKIEKHGIEVDRSRLKKVDKMRRAIELIQNYNEDRYYEIVEKEYGKLTPTDFEFEPIEGRPGLSQLKETRTEEEKEHDRKIFDKVRELEEKEWNELFEILKGQDYSKFDRTIDWDENFDGSGMRGWWD